MLRCVLQCPILCHALSYTRRIRGDEQRIPDVVLPIIDALQSVALGVAVNVAAPDTMLHSLSNTYH